MTFKTSDGYEYMQDKFGIHQLNPRPFTYDTDYCAIYDNPERERKSDVLQALRLGFIVGAHGRVPDSVLDYGSGNFAFLKTAAKLITCCFGYDVADYPAPLGVVKSDYKRTVDVVTFHDALEHVANPAALIPELNCETIVISLPNRANVPVPDGSIADFNYNVWFDKEYFHRKPNEHLHHFTKTELEVFMYRNGWKCVSLSRHEDVIRQRGTWNIISMAFKKLTKPESFY